MSKKAVNRKISAPAAPTCSESNFNKSMPVVEAENTNTSVSKTKVPCEFCNEPCSLEALMRHQVSADSEDQSQPDFWMLDWFFFCISTICTTYVRTFFSSKWFLINFLLYLMWGKMRYHFHEKLQKLSFLYSDHDDDSTMFFSTSLFHLYYRLKKYYFSFFWIFSSFPLYFLSRNFYREWVQF